MRRKAQKEISLYYWFVQFPSHNILKHCLTLKTAAWRLGSKKITSKTKKLKLNLKSHHKTVTWIRCFCLGSSRCCISLKNSVKSNAEDWLKQVLQLRQITVSEEKLNCTMWTYSVPWEPFVHPFEWLSPDNFRSVFTQFHFKVCPGASVLTPYYIHSASAVGRKKKVQVRWRRIRFLSATEFIFTSVIKTGHLSRVVWFVFTVSKSETIPIQLSLPSDSVSTEELTLTLIVTCLINLFFLFFPPICVENMSHNWCVLWFIWIVKRFFVYPAGIICGWNRMASSLLLFFFSSYF